MSSEIREQRLQEGCCPNCGIQLYKIISKSKANVMSKMSMFNNKSQDMSSNYPKKEPLNIPGIVERGQCVKCANGNTNIAVSSSDVVEDTLTSSSPIAIGEHMLDVAAPVKAVPVTISPSINDNVMARKPPPSSPVVGNLKQPPETLLAAAMKKEKEESSSSGSEESDSDDSSYYTTSSGDGESLEDVDMLIDTQMHRLESDQASSDLVNTLKKNAKFNASGQVGDYIPPGKGGIDTVVDSDGIVIDDRKPAAKPTVKESSDQLCKLQLEAAAIDMACLEATNSKPQDNTKKLQCPSGMSPDVFYELPPEMQKEVLAQEARKSYNASESSDIDPETLASLPDNIRQEVLEQARREQQQKANSTSADTAAISSSIDRLEDMKKQKLSASTTAFLSDCDINAEDYENFPDEVKKDIMKEKQRRDSKTNIEPMNQAQLDDLDSSGYDRETLASLPEELRNEVLEEERRKKEKKRRESQASGNRPSAVGAHSVSNVPAGYDPETFAELPEEMKRELLDDAARRQQSGGGRYSADGYDYESIVDAQVVSAQPIRSGGGTATSCTYEGEYNIMGKRHGDGELKWANGDKYVGKFKNGYIDGRGTINFHDGKFVLYFQ